MTPNTRPPGTDATVHPEEKYTDGHLIPPPHKNFNC